MYGRPRWSKEYGRSLITDEESHYLVSSLMLMATRPFFLALVPTCLRSGLSICKALKRLLPRYSQTLYQRFLPRLNSLTSRATEVTNLNAQIELMTGFVLLLQLVTGYQSFMGVLLFWQYLRFRYMLSSYSRQAFAQLRMTLDGWLLGPNTYAPRFVGMLYEKFKGLLAVMTDMQRQQSPCTVM